MGTTDPMGTGELIALVFVVAITVVALGYFFFVRRHPENADRHEGAADRTADATGRGTLPGDVQERPAGPGAEGEAVTGRGVIETGPGPGPSTGEDREST